MVSYITAVMHSVGNIMWAAGTGKLVRVVTKMDEVKVETCFAKNLLECSGYEIAVGKIHCGEVYAYNTK